jgi:hypothetical protein
MMNDTKVSAYPKLRREPYCDRTEISIQDYTIVFPITFIHYVELEEGFTRELDLYSSETDLGIEVSHTHYITFGVAFRKICQLTPKMEAYILYELGEVYSFLKENKKHELIRFIYCKFEMISSRLHITFRVTSGEMNIQIYEKILDVSSDLYL